MTDDVVERQLARTHRSMIWFYILCAVIVVVCISILGTRHINQLIINNSKLSIQMNEMDSSFETRFQLLSAGITFDQKRKRTLLALRDIIVEINPQITSAKAYEIAETNLEQCDRFKRIDPLLLVAIQKVESTFNSEAVSHKGALGLNQIWPSTGRLLCRVAGWEYREKDLLDIEKSTYLACLLLDILHVEYDGTEKLILADYNGGPKNAYLMKIGSDNCSQETQMYVENVLIFRDNLKERMEKSI